MLDEPLPTSLDARKAATRGARIRGNVQPAQLPRFAAMLANPEGKIAVTLDFSRDEQERYVIEVGVEADVTVICQRCLGPMPENISCQTLLALVMTDQQAAALPKHLDPLLVVDQMCDLHELVEEELILAARPFSYHEASDCGISLDSYTEAAEEVPVRERPNPFEMLGQLKLDEEH